MVLPSPRERRRLLAGRGYICATRPSRFLGQLGMTEGNTAMTTSTPNTKCHSPNGVENGLGRSVAGAAQLGSRSLLAIRRGGD